MKATRRVLIIGSGFGGLGLAIRLKRAGIESFTILEKATTLGGTWRDNTYPGAACDVPSMLYSFSFEPNTDWSRKWSGQAEIHAYMERCAEKNDLLRHIRFGVEVASARFDEKAGTWTVRTTTGEELVADVLVSGVGQLHRPQTPSIPGLESFRGATFHSARWNHDVDLKGKRVGVIGNAASAVQFVPEIAKEVGHLTVFQRSANWMIARGDRPFHPWETWILKHVPGALRLYRGFLWGFAELLLYPVMRQKRTLAKLYTKWAMSNLETNVPDPALRAKLTPDYPIGGKRILIHDDFFPALNLPNVELVTSPIARITENAVVTTDETVHEVDALIFATGFRTNPFLAPMKIEGARGRSLEVDWSHGARAYFGLTMTGYPNFFMLYGPNTNLGHNSIIFMLECQIAYVMDAIQWLIRDDLKSIDLRPEVMESFNEQLQRDLATTSWAAAPDSWYKDGGRITNNWPYSTFEYWRRTRALVHAEYSAESRRTETARDASGPTADRSAAA
jgi:cation diffusion facilitator CzcD-associated flavoprotein CzcO